mmetsp:Transcript_50759/g.153684  ORF Transcript_50759/g.153684 Transcript_50759/m.153684 type:complete len:95 (-) Transcript_50759:210-494(-)
MEGERRSGGSEAAKAPAVDKSLMSQVLSLHKKYELPPKSVTFEPGAEADLTIACGGGTCGIRFYDDSAREHWRRALAYILMKTEKTWTRSTNAG